MKRLVVLFSLFSLCIIDVAAQKSASLTQEIFSRYVEEKVMNMQELIAFDDAQAAKIRLIEMDFLLKVNKAEHCFLCNKRKRMAKLKEKRTSQLQQVLDRDQYIKYDAIENDRIRKGDLRVR